MRVETSNQTENTSSQSGKSIAEGKRKEESEGLALSLQDVFSDSGNASGSSQKTSRLFKSEQGKEAQLKGKKNQNQSEIFLEAAENLS
jgi:hypothetical protein